MDQRRSFIHVNEQELLPVGREVQEVGGLGDWGTRGQDGPGLIIVTNLAKQD